MLLPASTGFGEAVFVTDRFGPEPPTIVVADAVLFAALGSVAEDATAAVFVITVPLATPVFTFTTMVKDPDVAPAIFVSVQVTLPVPPRLGMMQLQPAGALNEIKVVFAGTAVVSVALSAALGPVFVTTCVYVMFAPAATGFGEAASVTDISALDPMMAVSVARSLSRLASLPPLIVAILVTVAGADCRTLTLRAMDG